jgi:hypothetical protein
VRLGQVVDVAASLLLLGKAAASCVAAPGSLTAHT